MKSQGKWHQNLAQWPLRHRVRLNTKDASMSVPSASLQIPQLNVLAAMIWILLVSALLILISCFSSSIACSFGIPCFCPLILDDLTRGGPHFFYLFALLFLTTLTSGHCDEIVLLGEINLSHRSQLGSEELAGETSRPQAYDFDWILQILSMSLEISMDCFMLIPRHPI